MGWYHALWPRRSIFHCGLIFDAVLLPNLTWRCGNLLFFRACLFMVVIIFIGTGLNIGILPVVLILIPDPDHHCFHLVPHQYRHHSRHHYHYRRMTLESHPQHLHHLLHRKYSCPPKKIWLLHHKIALKRFLFRPFSVIDCKDLSQPPNHTRFQNVQRKILKMLLISDRFLEYC